MFKNNPWKFFFSSLLLSSILLTCFTAAGLSQTLFPKKHLLFTQVIAADYFMSSINVTNRGPATYNGTLYFITGAEGYAWSPEVNGSQTTFGTVDVVIPADSSTVFTVKDSVFTVGYAFFISDDYSLDNQIEGNLSYFYFNGSTLLDAVGVPASREFRNVTLPFDSFNNVGLSLAQPLFIGQPAANVNLLLYDEDGNAVASHDFQLSPGEHFSRYLYQLDWNGAGVPDGFGPIGKVEIYSDSFISGICMLVTPGGAALAQISTLPLGGAPLTYQVQFNGSGEIAEDVYAGDLTIWIEGYYVNGYLKLTSINEEPVTDPHASQPILVTGHLVDNKLNLSFFTGFGRDPYSNLAWPGVSNYGAVVYMYVGEFSPTANIYQGDLPWMAYNIWDSVEKKLVGGTITLNNTQIPD